MVEQVEEIKTEKKESEKDLTPVEESDYLKAWRALPKSKRERLTKKQIARIDAGGTLFDALITEVKGP